jgi:hypothetical protein
MRATPFGTMKKPGYFFFVERSNAPRIMSKDAESLPYRNCDKRLTLGIMLEKL